MSRGSRRPIAALAAAGVLVLAGCGGGDDKPAEGPNAQRYSGDKKDVAAVIDRLTRAARTGDTREICENIFSPTYTQRVISETQTCQGTVKANIVSPAASFSADAVTVQGERAAVKVHDQEKRVSLLSMERQAGDWRITRIRTP